MISKIIGISGNMGAGKTTLAHALQQDLNSTLLCWDDFDDISTGPLDYVEWYHRGQDYNEWNYHTLADVLKLLKANQPVSHPVFKQMLNPTEYIVFDAPLGRLHQQTGKYIDIWIHINVPLDVSLCRHLLREFKNTSKTKEELFEELEYYLSQSRPLFFDDAFKAGADLVIDGMLTTEEQIQKINAYLKREN
jgi:uridine kinase